MNKFHYIIPIFVPHEGCPHTCVFCNQDSITGSCFKIDGEFVENTIKEYLETMDKEESIIEVSFFGGTFTAIDINKQNELLSVAKKYKDCNKIDYIRLSTRPDYIDHRILNNLKEHSVDIIELGVQSLDDEVLIKSGRGHSSQDVKSASELIKEYGFTLGHQVMIGLPGDTKEKDIITAKNSISMSPDICRIYPALVIKNTPMETLLQRGEYKPYDLEEAVEISKIIYGMYVKHDINVIRIGLQPTEEINYEKEIVEGPFHPAFRELVEGSIYKDLIVEYFKNHSGIESISINPKDISKLYANKKKYFNEALKILDFKKLKVNQDTSVKRGDLKFNFKNNEEEITLKDYLKRKVNV
ncbi:MAG: radical SAM protein [Clostridium argentinense]|uniref:Radical SAM protein n=1 Tax=Clostridium faecium TaxID=2762223 RepID=A0ABR8YX74_9CLOT|nr:MULTISPECIES: radical SAM protein [Clostridium]MBD8048883.1 radical SAM protein [Clostridium faecium]MBS5822776.1 radical SAM protein [Clostridium argentinense]MDU1348132.1 radical SAM protein [Clostridium argentinense]